MAGWLHGLFVGEWLLVFPLCGFSLSLFCNYTHQPHELHYQTALDQHLNLYTCRLFCSSSGVAMNAYEHGALLLAVWVLQ